MLEVRTAAEWRRLWRYYQAGIVNTLFGYGTYAVLVSVDLSMYVAQIAAHALGATFNYFTYSRYAFAGHEASKARFILSYAVNYFFSLACLAALALVILSPYLAGLGATLIASLVNYIVLKRLVFRTGGPSA
jgi:putative flippase GtrA